jgi:hypothetical protein
LPLEGQSVVQVVVVVVLGACQKSPQPTMSGVAASKIFAQLPNFIVAPPPSLSE